MALEYRTRSASLAERSGPMSGRRTARRSPRDIVLQFHSAIYFQTTRAVVGRALAASGMAARGPDATACAAQALAHARRSRRALLRLADDDERRSLVVLLDRLSRHLEDLFPDAAAASRSTFEVRFRGTKGNQDRHEREI
jgi:hypothetical protein